MRRFETNTALKLYGPHNVQNTVYFFKYQMRLYNILSRGDDKDFPMTTTGSEYYGIVLETITIKIGSLGQPS